MRHVGNVLRLIEPGRDAAVPGANGASEREEGENCHGNEQIARAGNGPAARDCGYGGGRHMSDMPAQELNFRVGKPYSPTTTR